MSRIERRAKVLVKTGATSKWLEGCNRDIAKLGLRVNGPLLEELASEIDYHDSDCILMFFYGGKLVGALDRSGNGVPLEDGLCDSDLLAALVDNRESLNRKVLSKLREDPHSEAIMQMCKHDFELGRMSKVYKAHEIDLTKISISPRFVVEQGLKEDGSVKLRPIDDFSASGCNACTNATEKLRYHTLDMFLATLRLAFTLLGGSLSMWKADVDAAFRRIPITESHSEFAWIAFLFQAQWHFARHIGMPFGSIASVHNWDRIASLILAIAQRLLWLPCFRFVDDYFCCDRDGSCEVAMRIFARLVRCLLGVDSIAERKLCFGNPLVILGISVRLQDLGITFVPDKEKVAKWCACIRDMLWRRRCCAGEASKLSGRLMWASSFVFKKVGRALLYVIYRQVRARSSKISEELELALRWWLHALELGISEIRSWTQIQPKMAHLFVDARSTPPRVAAVLLKDRRVWYSDVAPPRRILQVLRNRNDGQIMSLEILSIAFGISVMEELCSDCNVVVYSDNVGAQNTTAKGAAKAFDHTCLIHGIWSRALQMRTGLHICRVPSCENIADLPSREEYWLLHRIGAQFIEPHFHSTFLEAQTWESLKFTAWKGRLFTPCDA